MPHGSTPTPLPLRHSSLDPSIRSSTSPSPSLSSPLTFQTYRLPCPLCLHLSPTEVFVLTIKKFGACRGSRQIARAHVNASIDTLHVNVLVDLGYPLLNRVVDGFVKVGGLSALHAASQDTYKFLLQEETNKKSLEKTVKRMGKEAVQWGLVTVIYIGMTYGMQEARGVHDWKNAFLGGALTGAALSLTEPNPRSDRVVRGAITGGAITTAAEFLRNLT